MCVTRRDIIICPPLWTVEVPSMFDAGHTVSAARLQVLAANHRPRPAVMLQVGA